MDIDVCRVHQSVRGILPSFVHVMNIEDYILYLFRTNKCSNTTANFIVDD